MTTNELKNLRTRANENRLNKIAEKTFYIENGFCESWAEKHKTRSDNGIKAYSTDTRWKQYNDGKITREKAIELAIKRATKEIEKQYQNDIDKIAAAENTLEVKEIYINVNWHKSSYYGYCPNVTIDVITENNYIETFTAKASGYGYDKESTAIGSALNQSEAVLKMLYNLAEISTPEEYSPNCFNYRNSIGYGSGYNYLPYFEGGVGFSSHVQIFKNCGYTVKRVRDTKLQTTYIITKNS